MPDYDQHEAIINLIYALGYKDPLYKEGLCHGITFTAFNSCFIGEMKNFNQRFSMAQLKGKSLAGQIKSVETRNAERARIRRQDNTGSKVDAYQFTSEESFLMEMRAMVETILRLQYPELNYDLFSLLYSQDQMQEAIDITASAKLLALGGMKKIDRLIHSFNKSELCDFLKILNEIAQTKNVPFAILLNNIDHSMGLFYEPYVVASHPIYQEAGRWYFVNSNNLPIEDYSLNMLVKRIEEGFLNKSNQFVFSSDFYTVGDNYLVGLDIVAQLKNKISDARLDELTNERVFAMSKAKVNLLHLAIRYEHIELVKLLLAMGASISPGHGNSSLHYTASTGNQQLISILLNAGANINAVASYQHIYVFNIAVANNQLATVKKFVAENAILNISSHPLVPSVIATALMIANKFGYKEMTQYLTSIDTRSKSRRDIDNWLILHKDTLNFIMYDNIFTTQNVILCLIVMYGLFLEIMQRKYDVNVAVGTFGMLLTMGSALYAVYRYQYPQHLFKQKVTLFGDTAKHTSLANKQDNIANDRDTLTANNVQLALAR